MYRDTICAPATPPGEGGIAVVRVSGAEAVAATARLVARQLHDRRVTVGTVRDPVTGEPLDEALVLLMRGPRSFTGEDVVELHLHGSPLIVGRVLRALLSVGVRAAEPGEFSLRAFLNGRLDLAQAESVLDLIRARSEAAGRVAVEGLRGAVSEPVRATRDALLSTLAYLVARIDFPDEDVPAEPIAAPLGHAVAQLDALLAGAEMGRLYRDGARVAVIGPPNAGKSSLLNRLLRHDRAIVTPVAGTTRDTLEETAIIHGIPVTLVDTAGLSPTPDAIEALGIERSRAAAARADALLLVLDGSAPLPAEFNAMLDLTRDRPTLLLLNKYDLLDVHPDVPPVNLAAGMSDDAPRREDVPPPIGTQTAMTTLAISALRGDGIDVLESTLATILLGATTSATAVTVANPRHADALRRARASLTAAIDGAAAGLPEDFIAIDVRAALDALGEITGETAGEDLLNTIFRRFCIGK